jgi:hypothetical protein
VEPNSALVAARCGPEVILRKFYTTLRGRDGSRMNPFDMVREYGDGGYLPEPVKEHFHTVRSLGNIGAHGDPSQVEADDVEMTIRACVRTGEWARRRRCHSASPAQ